MIRFLKSFVGSVETVSSSFKLKIFVDKIKTKSKKSFSLTVDKNMKMKELRKKISETINKNEDEIVLMIEGKFWDDENTIGDVLRSSESVHVVRAVVVTLEEQETIDYDVELFLREKYSVADTTESEYMFTVEVNVKYQVEEDISFVCGSCKLSKLKNLAISLDYCGHEFCKNCLSSAVYKDISISVKCPHGGCNRELTDHEIQKILGQQDYSNWENSVNRISKQRNDFKFPKIGWICKSCTFLNKPLITFCETCNEVRPGTYRVPIFYEPSQEEKLKFAKSEEELKQQEKEKIIRLEELRNLSKESVSFTSESTECPICLLDYGSGEAIVLHGCLHTICMGCLHSYLVNVENAQVMCPTENCIGLLEDREIASILTLEEYEKYQELNLRMAEAKEQLSFHCKEVNCQGWIVHDGFLNSFKCPRCKKTNCIKCEAIHSDLSCQEYQMKKLSIAPDPNQSKNEQYIQSMINAGNALKCPGCKMIVEKNRGCDGVLCRNCGMMICWATKGPRWGPKGKGDTSGGCGCRFFWGRRCHPSCHYCH